MRLITLGLVLLFALVFGPQSSALAGDMTDCSRTEQVGCFELDLINFAYNPHNSLMVKMVGSGNVNGAINPDWGPRLYQQYKGGSAKSAGSKSFYVYTWNASCPASNMMEYHILGRNGANPARRDVTEVAVNVGPSGATGYSIGAPHQAFVVNTDKAVAAIQFPWGCINANTYILVCTGDDVTVFPDRVTGQKGIWLTPSQLASYRAKGFEYILLPHLSL
ncbi:MAG TPA: hypothetical protein VHS96_11350 [Bacteroidia bacterium]|nr:hypothetical protein [Bacteroidia bacterium]